MRKSIMQIASVTLAMVFGVAAAAPPALAGETCVCARHHAVSAWRPHRTVAVWRRHHHWTHSYWAHRGWGPGIGFAALTGVGEDHPAMYNHPYYYGGGPYGNCESFRVIYDTHGNILGRQGVYIC